MGHNVYSAVNGIDAIEAIKENDFDLILMDIQMPEMNGIDATAGIRNGLSGYKNQNIPIAAMSANTSLNASNKYLESGMNGLLPKPISYKSVSRLLNEIF